MARYQRSTAQIALKWLVQNGMPVVTKSANPQHLAEDVDLFGEAGTPAIPRAEVRWKAGGKMYNP